MTCIIGTNTNPTPVPGLTGGSAQAFGKDALFRSDFDAIVGRGLLSNSDYNPLVDSATYDLTQGVNPASRDDSYTGGVLTAPHGGTGSAYIIPVNLKPGAGKFVVANPSTVSWGVGGDIAIALTPTGASLLIDIALSSNVDDLCTMRLFGTTSTTQFHLIADGSVSASGKSDVACNSVATIGSGLVVSANNFHRFMIGFNAQTGVFSCSVDGVLAASTIPGNHMPTKAMTPMLDFNGQADVCKIQGLWMGWSE